MKVVGRYELGEPIGYGGMAVVYLARQTDLDREVALKELRLIQAPDDPALTERFLREARVSGSMGHPNIVTVHEYFKHEGTPYIAMEYLRRGSLRPWVARMTLAQVAGVLEGLLAALDHAEAYSIVHRDLKPENLLVTDQGQVKVADFGIARARTMHTSANLTAAGTTVGTPTYMAPEQAMAQDLGPFTDLYSVGVMAYEMLVGAVPFGDTEAPLSIMLRHVNETIPPAHEANPQVDPALSAWIDSLLVKDPAQRVQTAEAAWDVLEDIVLRLLGSRWRREARLMDTGQLDAAAPLTPAPFTATDGATPVPDAVLPTAPPQAVVTPPPAPAPEPVAEPVADDAADEFQTFARIAPVEPEAVAVAEPEPAAAPVAEPVPEPVPEPELEASPTPEPELDTPPTPEPEPEPVAEPDRFRTYNPRSQPAGPEPAAPPPPPPPVVPEPEPEPAVAAVALEPTIMPKAAPARPAPPAPKVAPPAGGGQRRTGVLIGGGGLAAVAIVGVVLATSGGGGKDKKTAAPPSGTATPAASAAVAGALALSTDDLSLSAPAGYGDKIAPPGLPGLAANRTVAAGPSAGGFIAASLIPGTADPSLLPAALLAQIKGKPTPETVTLAGVRAYRYGDLTRRSGKPLRAFTVLTTGGVATVLCGGAGGAVPTGAGCDTVAGTLKLSSAAALDVGPSKTYGKVLNTTFAALQHRISKLRIQTASGSVPQQTAVLQRFESAYTAADTTLAKPKLNPVDTRVNAKLKAGFRQAAAACRQLIQALQHGDRKGLAAARKQLARAQATLKSATGALDEVGYASAPPVTPVARVAPVIPTATATSVTPAATVAPPAATSAPYVPPTTSSGGTTPSTGGGSGGGGGGSDGPKGTVG